MAAVFASAREGVRAVLPAQQGLGGVEWGEVTGPLLNQTPVSGPEVRPAG
jgi:hypothetical protein